MAHRNPTVKKIGLDVRCLFLKCNIYYFIENDQIIVFGVIHGRRRQRAALLKRFKE